MSLLTGETKIIVIKKGVNVSVRKDFFQNVLSGSATRCQFEVAEIILQRWRRGQECEYAAVGLWIKFRVTGSLMRYQLSCTGFTRQFCVPSISTTC